MRISSVVKFFVLAALAISSWAANAVLISNAAYAGTFARDCRSAAAIAAGSTVPDKCQEDGGPDGLSFVGTLRESRQDIQLGKFNASISATSALAQSGAKFSTSSVDASGVAGTLILKQGAFTSLPYARTSGQSRALQSFAWDGTGATMRSIHNELNFTASNLMSNAEFFADTSTPGNIVNATVSVFSLTTASFDFDFTSGVPDFASWAESHGAAGYRLETSARYSDITASPLSTSLSFGLEAGRTYFVESWLGLWAKFGAEIDATHTFTTTLGETDTATGEFIPGLDGLTPAAASIAEPTGLALLAIAVAALGATRRRRYIPA